MKKLKLATVWLDGCSGCHMSLLDLDGALIAIAARSTWSTARWSTPGVPRRRGCDPGRGRSQQPGGSGASYGRSAAHSKHPGRRSAIAPSPATSPAMRNAFR